MLTLTQAAEHCHVSRVTLWKSVKSGVLKSSTTPGGHYRILKEDLKSFMLKKGIYPVAGYHPQTRKILIVDDDPSIRTLFSKILSAEQYEIDTAADGFEAGVKIVQFKPGLVLLDLYMPGISGFEICKRIKEVPETSSIKVLAITGFGSEENEDKIMASGSDGYLTKPVERKTLLEGVGKLLRRQAAVIS